MTTVNYDLTQEQVFCGGVLSYENGEIKASENGEAVTVIPLSKIKALTLITHTGCGVLEAVPKDARDEFSENTVICRFSMTYIYEIGEFGKVINHLIETGEEAEIDKEKTTICPVCHRRYPKNLNTCLFCAKKSLLFTRLMKLSKSYLPGLLGAGLLLSIASLVSSLTPVFSGKLTDKLMEGSADLKYIAVIIGLMILTQAAGQFFNIISSRCSRKISLRLNGFLRQTVFDKIQRMTLSSMSTRKSGDLMKRVTSDTEKVKDFITEQGMYAIEKAAMFILILVILLRISPFLTFLVLAPVPFVILAFFGFWRFIHVRYEKQWRSESRANSILHDIVKGIRVVKTFGTEKQETDKFTRACRFLADTEKSNEKLWAKTFPFLSFFMGIGEFFVLYFGGRLALDGKITAGQLLQFTLYLAYIYEPLRWVSSLPRRLGEVTTSLLKIFEILDEKDDTAFSEEEKDISLKGKLEFRNVRFGYNAYEPVLKNISLTVNPGEMIGLVGHSGAGKSTVINLIMRLYEPDYGGIYINGKNLTDISPGAYRSRIGVVFQENFLFAGTIYDNIVYGRPGATPAEVIAAAKKANAHGFIMKTPDGYNTMVGEDGHTLSGGERQRISIARAILRNPDILILDEATSALDPETEAQIQDALAGLIKGRTTFAIAHRLATLKNADRLVVIEKGQIAETGTHRELLLQNGIYASLVKAQKSTSKLSK